MKLCPECSSEEVIVYIEEAIFLNTYEHYCHSVKPQDLDASVRCIDCGWEGSQEDLNKEV